MVYSSADSLLDALRCACDTLGHSTIDHVGRQTTTCDEEVQAHLIAVAFLKLDDRLVSIHHNLEKAGVNALLILVIQQQATLKRIPFMSDRCIGWTQSVNGDDEASLH